MKPKNDTLKFDDLPMVMADLIEQVHELRSSIETLTTKIRDRPRPTLSIDVAAGIICKSKSTIYKIVAAGDIPHHKQGNRLYFFEDELVAWIASHRSQAEQEADFRAAQDAAIKYIEKRRRKTYL